MHRISNLTIIEKQALKRDITAGSMLDALNRDDFIALYINFDTNKAVIKPESVPIVEQIATLLNDNTELNIGVEGNTDSTGTPENIKPWRKNAPDPLWRPLLFRVIDESRLSANDNTML